MYATYQLIQLLLRLLVYTFIGQGLLALMLGPGRRTNPVWCLFDAITRPVWRLTRALLPRVVPDSAIGALSVLLLLVANLILYMVFHSRGWLAPG